MSTVCVVGLGYIGLPVASMLASRGHEVIGYDINEAAVRSINQGVSHFFEPDLDMLLEASVQTGRLRAQSEPSKAEFYVLAVPTPLTDEHKPDLSYVMAATEAIASFLDRGATVILESTSPVGTTERINARLAELRPDLKFAQYGVDTDGADVAIAHCPERILPGHMLRELVNNDRIVGGMTGKCSEAAARLYRTFVTGDIFMTDCRTAEFVKLVENSYRDVNIAFANELSMISERLGVDVWSAIKLANRHPRVSILNPGAGVGGHCIAVDPWFIVDSAPEESRIIKAARIVNDGKALFVVDKVKQHAARFRQPVIACYGLTYKPDVEDLRESPALEIAEELAEIDSALIKICDPWIKELPRKLADNDRVELVDAEQAREACDIAVFLVGHSQFKGLDQRRFINKVVVDAIGLFAR
ncbi:UDP-N-acetyl-D-mannosamine dehydrogenase [Enterovirga rhinocerotis]|uniref:UDP-N-acetyl-D-mannosaminuronic acid dehydrogenase n=1 Tax=Enterovirga rhinocerotis TaxID=1339210 RepID=A0A4R7BYJ4_9HYPH|nr:UDP-N-acetyl-D-mannosamine dehydrogenase [Enterovirga rhinocerotis]TDR89287.1 UDP-N-acetyl-D-mannosaminuronic acid dehydrogenase [Enterovirga rhinocerotis]